MLGADLVRRSLCAGVKLLDCNPLTASIDLTFTENDFSRLQLQDCRLPQACTRHWIFNFF